MWTIRLLVAACLGVAALPAPAQVEILDIPFASVSGRTLYTDIYLPAQESSPVPLVVWIHGGGWIGGNRKLATNDARRLVAQGFAVAAIEYRLSTEAPWPAQLHDCKGAVRWLRANAAALGIDPWGFFAFGESAGGQLAAVLAASGGCHEMEGAVGGHLTQSSRVQGVASFMAPHDMFALNGFHLDPNSLESLLLGAPLGEIQRRRGGPSATVYEWRARTASTVSWLDRSDPPMLLCHGMLDPIYPWHQSQFAHERGLAVKLASSLAFDEHAGHQMPPAMYEVRDRWLRANTDPEGPIRVFGKGLPAIDGDEPSIGVVRSPKAVVLTLDGAPPGGLALLLVGTGLGGGFLLVPPAAGLAEPTTSLFSPLWVRSAWVDLEGCTEVALPVPARARQMGATWYAQWVVRYSSAAGAPSIAASNGVRIR